ncbi:Protein kinase-like domain protein [Cordyceps fumosorosea ARSEF 2679]|uniref:Protein kinase-like domain protein n=1 Tax=Cordyceps fumosorosea (strain ARSEF 2679) TaxID=1081104 RepID=A0A167LZI0_CORFA|nr:Protein kinase-like domain protein [Cordyceps fumosorosea ARSEF 2679]OAA53724.1 Protein kinase-like domain protein [Cordyceps fumosorosea ARSEF 2679]
MASPRPDYRICEYAASELDETPAWLSLKLRLHARILTISVQEARFLNSPACLREFRAYVAAVNADLAGAGRDSVDDCFAWAAAPFLPAFAELAPKPVLAASGAAPVVTLADVLGLPKYECALGAVDDRLDPGPITVVAGTEHSEDLVPDNLPPVSDTSLAFPLSEVELITEDGCDPYDEDPRRVRVRGQECLFEPTSGFGDDFAAQLIGTYERLAHAALPPSARVSQLFGVVQDPGHPVAGILLHPIAGGVSLEDALAALDALTPEKEAEARVRWAGQLSSTLAALHERGLVWGDAWAGNVTVDARGDAWIVDFAGGRTDGWVSEELAGTAEGDLEGLGKIVHFINKGEEPGVGEEE